MAPKSIADLLVQPYISGQCDQLLKWKPSDLNSVDFRLSVVERNQPGYVLLQPTGDWQVHVHSD